MVSRVCLKKIEQGPVDPLAVCKQGVRGRLKIFKQGPVKKFRVGSAQKILSKVRLKFFT